MNPHDPLTTQAAAFVDFSPEVETARTRGAPLVALESTIIAHGMPYPQNLETARLLEQDIRDEGAVPATIAIIEGRIKIGLTPENLEFLATAKNVRKASRADFPGVLARREHAATTVAGTMIGAWLGGIRLFATGGIGGVHRGAETTFDISADLEELANTPVAVVSAGAKAILDLPLTLEYLETRGVPVIGFETDEFPAFYTRESGLKLVEKAETAEIIARMLDTKWKLGLSGGALIANPIPIEYALESSGIDRAIEEALMLVETQEITGKAVTPFLLGKLNEITAGSSLKANIALVRNNARVAARIAVALNRLKG